MKNRLTPHVFVYKLMYAYVYPYNHKKHVPRMHREGPGDLGAQNTLEFMKNWRCSSTLSHHFTNNDDKCFLYSVLAVSHPATSNPQRVSNYTDCLEEPKTEGLNFPLDIPQIPLFESKNTDQCLLPKFRR